MSKNKDENVQKKQQTKEASKENIANRPGSPEELTKTDHAGEETAAKSSRKGAGQQQGSGGNPVIN